MPAAATNNNIQLPFTTSHAFVVGINAYQHLTPLSTAVNDASEIAKNLREQHGFTVHEPLLDASFQGIRKLLTEVIPNTVGTNDRVLFYFAGHGIALDGEEGPNGYLVAADTRPGEEQTLIPMQLLHDALTSLPCRHGLLILDCCFSGAFKWSSGFRDVVFDLPKVIYEERFWRYCKDPAWQVITSAAHDQKAVDIITNQSLGLRESNGGMHSPFAESLLKALNGEGDVIPTGSGDGVITATELYAYLRDSVENTTQDNHKRQSPSIFNLDRHDKGEFIFLHPSHRFNLPPTPDRNPFMGLSSYNEDDAPLFYGRDRVIKALVERINAQNLLVVSGASGTGKSSVIKAGLLPYLRKNGYEILPVVRPGKEPFTLLKTGFGDKWDKLAEGPTVLVIDQYEELISQCLYPEERTAFEKQLGKWLTTQADLRIVISVRSDFEPQFESGPLQQWWSSSRYVVPSFNLEEIREIITKPAAQAVLFYEPEELVEQLTEEVSQSPGALPLLSFTLSELYHAYLKSGRSDRALIGEDYEKLGGVVGALRTRADAEYEQLGPDMRSSMRTLMLRMVSLEGGELAGKRVYAEELQFKDEQKTKRLQKVADRLVDARLLYQGKDGQGRTFIEPAHDALVRAWARLWEWIKTVGEEKITLQYKLSQAVNDYHELLGSAPKKARNLLWNNNPRLDLLQAELVGKDHGLNAQEETFVRESVQRRSARRRNTWMIAIAVMLGLAGLAIYAFLQRNEALRKTQEAQAAGLGSKALAVFSENPTAAINIANIAYELSPVDDARQALLNINSNTDGRSYQQVGAHESIVNKIVFAPGDSTYVSAGREGKVILWTRSGEQIGLIQQHSSPVNAISFSADGAYIMSGSEDGLVQIMDTDGKVLQQHQHAHPVREVLLIQAEGETWGFFPDPKGNIWRLNRKGSLRKVFSLVTLINNEGSTYRPIQERNVDIPTIQLRPVHELWDGGVFADDIETSPEPTGIQFYVNDTDTRKFTIDFSGYVVEDSGSFPVGDTDPSIMAIDYSPQVNAYLEVSYGNTVSITGDSGEKRSSYQFGISPDGFAAATLLPRTKKELLFSSDLLPDVLFALNDYVLWCRPNGQEKMRFGTHRDGISTMSVSSDGRYLLTGGKDGRILLWMIQPYIDIPYYEDVLMLQTQMEQGILTTTTDEWNLRRIDNNTIVLSRDGVDLQTIVETTIYSWIDTFAISQDGAYIYTFSKIANALGEDFEEVNRKWPNRQYAYEHNLVATLTTEEVLTYNIPEEAFPFLRTSTRNYETDSSGSTAPPAAPPQNSEEVQQAYVKDVIERSWRTAGAELIYEQGGFPGARSLYEDASSIISLSEVQQLSPVPVFLSGPHKGEFDLKSKDSFGHYNPEFLEWIKEDIIPAKDNPAIRATTQKFFDVYMKDMARSYYLVYAIKDQSEGLVGDIYLEHSSDIGELGEYYVYVGYDFWGRRTIDGTASLFYEILQDLLQTYDADWYSGGSSSSSSTTTTTDNSTTAESDSSDEAYASGILTGDNVRVRESPVDGAPIFKLSTGDRVKILDEQTPSGQAESWPWFYIDYNGQKGWIRSDFVQME